MSPQEVLSQLLTSDGKSWFLVVTPTGEAVITTEPEGHVVGKIECHQPEKNSSEDSTITAPVKKDAPTSHECEQHVSSSH